MILESTLETCKRLAEKERFRGFVQHETTCHSIARRVLADVSSAAPNFPERAGPDVTQDAASLSTLARSLVEFKHALFEHMSTVFTLSPEFATWFGHHFLRT